jgi:hypothetical protein
MFDEGAGLPPSKRVDQHPEPGRYPPSVFEYIEGVIRWHNRVAAYAFLLITDRYLPFSLQA